MHEDALRKIQEAVRQGRYQATYPHFADEPAEEDLTSVDAEAAILTGKIACRYTHDPRGVRYEIVGNATDGRRVAVVVRIEETGIPRLITVYLKEEWRP